MRRMHTFLEESDAASLCRRLRRCAQDIVARMSRTSPRRREDKSLDVLSRPMVFRHSISPGSGGLPSRRQRCAHRRAYGG